ncbi:MAG: beta strand repeat-containing protein [Candidatus Sericytochromatia bacterium]
MGAIAKILVQLIEAARKAAGFQADGGLLEGITGNLGKLGEALTTGSYETGRLNEDGTAERKGLNGVGQFLSDAIVKPIAELPRAAIQGAANGIAGAATRASEGISGQGSVASTSGQGNLTDQTRQAVQNGSFTEADEAAFRSTAASQNAGSTTVSGEEQTTQANTAVNQIRAGLITDATQGIQVGGQALNVTSDANGIKVNGVALDPDLAKQLTSGSATERAAGLATLTQAAQLGVLTAGSGATGLGKDGTVSLGSGTTASTTNLALLGTASPTPNPGNRAELLPGQPLPIEAAQGQPVTTTPVATTPVDLTAQTTTNATRLLQDAVGTGGTVANVQVNNGTLTATVNGQAISISGAQLQQLQQARDLGLTAQLDLSTPGAVQLNITAGTASGASAPTAVNPAQLAQLTTLKNAGLNVSAQNGVISVGGQQLTAQELTGLTALANQVGPRGLQGVTLAASGTGDTRQFTVGGRSLADATADVARASGTGQAVSLTDTGVQVGGAAVSRDGANQLSGALAAARDLGLNTTGARFENGALQLADGRSVSLDSNGTVTVATQGGASLRVDAATLQAVRGQIALGDQEGGRINNAIKSGLVLAATGQVGDVSVSFNANNPSTTPDPNGRVQVSFGTGATPTNLSLQSLEDIATGNVRARTFEQANITDSGTQALLLLGAQGVNVAGAKPATGPGGGIQLANGAIISQGALDKLASGDQATLASARALGIVTAGQNGRFDNVSLGDDGVLKSGATSFTSADVQAINASASQTNPLAARGQSLVDNARAQGRVSAPTTATTTATPASSAALSAVDAAIQTVGGDRIQTTGFTSDGERLSRRTEASVTSVGGTFSDAGRAFGRVGGQIGSFLGLSSQEATRDVAGALRATGARSLAAEIAQDPSTAPDRLRELGFSPEEVTRLTGSRSGIRERDLANALESRITVTSTRNAENGTTFTASVSPSGGAVAAGQTATPSRNLGSLTIAANGGISSEAATGFASGNTRFTALADTLNGQRNQAAADALNAQARSLASVASELRVSGVDLDAGGNIRSITTAGGQTLSAEAYARQLGSASGRQITAASLNGVAQNGFDLAGTRIGGANRITSDLRNGGSDAGFSQAVNQTLQNLRNNGVDVDNAVLQRNADGSVNLTIGTTSVVIDKNGAVRQAGTPASPTTAATPATGTPPGSDDAALRSLLAASGQTGQAVDDRLQRISGNQNELNQLTQKVNDAFAGGTLGSLLGTRAKDITATYGDDGRLNGANITLADGSRLSVTINQATGQVGIRDARDASGNALTGPAQRLANNLVQELRTNGLGQPAGGGITAALNRALGGNANVQILDYADNTRTQQRNDKNAANDIFDQEARVQIEVNGNRVNVGVAFDASGGVYLNTENLDAAGRQALAKAVLGKDTVTPAEEAQALQQLAQAVGSTSGSTDQQAAQIDATERGVAQTIIGAGGANVAFATGRLQAVLGDERNLGVFGDQKLNPADANSLTIRQAQDQLKTLVAAGDTAGAQAILDQVLAASGLEAGSVTVDQLRSAPGSNTLVNAETARERLGSVNVTLGYDGRVASISAQNIKALNEDGQAVNIGNLEITQNNRGERTINTSGVTGLNGEQFDQSIRRQFAENTPTTGDKIGNTINSVTKYLGAGLEAALPGLQALKKALEDMEEARVRLEAAKKQFAAALEYAQKIGLTYGSASGGDPGSLLSPNNALGNAIDAAGEASAGFVDGVNSALKFGMGGSEGDGPDYEGDDVNNNEIGRFVGGTLGLPPGSLAEQQATQSSLLQQVASDANFASIAVLLGQNPGLLIQQAQQMDMLEDLAQMIEQLQSPFGNPVQEMQRFVEQLRGLNSEAQLPNDGMQVLGG